MHLVTGPHSFWILAALGCSAASAGGGGTPGGEMLNDRILTPRK